MPTKIGPELTRRNVLLLAGVFALALALRLAHLAALRSSFEGTQLFSLARGDAAFHWAQAQDILHRDFWLRDQVPWKGPGYSYFLALCMKLLGPDPGRVRWGLAVLGSLNCTGLVLLARRRLPWRFSLAVGLVAAANGVLILFDGELLFPTLLITLNLPALYWLSAPRPSAAGLLGAGACLGLASLVHPPYLAAAALLALWLAVRSRRAAALFTAAVAVVVATTSLENLLVRGQPVLISWSGGVNLYVGNQPAFDPVSGQGTAAWGRVLHTTEDAGIEPEFRRDRAYYALAAKQALRAPLAAVAMLLAKARILLSPVEISNNLRLYELREHSPVARWTLGRVGPLWLPFGLWAPVALLGLAVARRPRARPASPLVSVLAWWSLGIVLSILLSFNTARYRLPLVFFGCVWVGLALERAWQVLVRHDRRTSWMLAGALLALGAFVAAMAVPQSTLPAPLEWSQAQAAEAAGQVDVAERWAQRAQARYAEDPFLTLAVANLLGRNGELQRQQELLRSVLVFHPDLEPDLECLVHEGLARSYLGAGDLARARHHAGAALALHVDDCTWHDVDYFRMHMVPSTACKLCLLLARIELAAGDPDEALALVGRVREDCPRAQRFLPELADLEATARADETRE